MELIHFITSHGIDSLGTFAIIASLLFTAFEVRHLERAQRITNLLTLTKHHREIWTQVLDRPELSRILDPKADLKETPVTTEESLFVTFAILHLQAAFRASEAKMLIPPDALSKDIAWFFSLPIPKAVWQRTKSMQDGDFLHFVAQAYSTVPSEPNESPSSKTCVHAGGDQGE